MTAAAHPSPEFLAQERADLDALEGPLHIRRPKQLEVAQDFVQVVEEALSAHTTAPGTLTFHHPYWQADYKSFEQATVGRHKARRVDAVREARKHAAMCKDTAEHADDIANGVVSWLLEDPEDRMRTVVPLFPLINGVSPALENNPDAQAADGMLTYLVQTEGHTKFSRLLANTFAIPFDTSPPDREAVSVEFAANPEAFTNQLLGHFFAQLKTYRPPNWRDFMYPDKMDATTQSTVHTYAEFTHIIDDEGSCYEVGKQYSISEAELATASIMHIMKSSHPVIEHFVSQVSYLDRDGVEIRCPVDARNNYGVGEKGLIEYYRGHSEIPGLLAEPGLDENALVASLDQTRNDDMSWYLMSRLVERLKNGIGR